VVTRLEDEEREELFNNMNKMERSRIINLAEKHCAQMMDLIYRYCTAQFKSSFIAVSILVTPKAYNLVSHQDHTLSQNLQVQKKQFIL
jgi:hypothetical protein